MDVIRVQLSKDDANELIDRFRAANIEPSSSTSRQMTGEVIFLSVIVPASLAAVQIVSTFIIARKFNIPKQAEEPDQIRISVNGKNIRLETFSEGEVKKLTHEGELS